MRTDFTGANLTDANLTDANIMNIIGDGIKIKTIHTGKWTIAYTDIDMAIGCKQYPIKDWMSFDNYRIDAMDPGAVLWWEKWKPIIVRMQTPDQKPNGN
jgi:hypothetical protein